MRAAAPCFGTQQIIHVSILHLSNVKVLTTIELPAATMISGRLRNGLRAPEVVDLRREQIDWNSATLHVHRLGNGEPSTHSIRGGKLRALRRLKRETLQRVRNRGRSSVLL